MNANDNYAEDLIAAKASITRLSQHASIREWGLAKAYLHAARAALNRAEVKLLLTEQRVNAKEGEHDTE